MNSDLIATRTRDQIHFQPNATRIEENVNMSGRTRSELALTTTKVKLSKALSKCIADYAIEHPTTRSARCEIANAALNSETGQMMEFRHLTSQKNSKVRAT